MSEGEGEEKKEEVEVKKQQQKHINTPDLENQTPNIKVSKSVFNSMYELASKSPAAAISSICALFIVIILSIIIPQYLL